MSRGVQVALGFLLIQQAVEFSSRSIPARDDTGILICLVVGFVGVMTLARGLDRAE
jgi:hypothetical protein